MQLRFVFCLFIDLRNRFLLLLFVFADERLFRYIIELVCTSCCSRCSCCCCCCWSCNCYYLCLEAALEPAHVKPVEREHETETDRAREGTRVGKCSPKRASLRESWGTIKPLSESAIKQTCKLSCLRPFSIRTFHVIAVSFAQSFSIVKVFHISVPLSFPSFRQFRCVFTTLMTCCCRSIHYNLFLCVCVFF